MATALTPHLPSIWRFSLSLCGRPDIADDLTQTTVVRAMERHRYYAPEEGLAKWCMGICRAIWTEELRSQSIRETHVIGGASTIHQIDPHMDLECNAYARQIFSKVMELPEAQRETVVLVYVEGFKYTEAAEILGVPLGTVMSRLAAVRKKLRPLGSTSMTSHA